MMAAMRRAITIFCILFLAGMLPATFARSETFLWMAKASGDLVSLAYGSPNPMKNPLFMLSCFNDMNIAVLDVHKDIVGAEPGKALTIELAAGDAKASIDGEATRDDTAGITFGEASDIALAPILAVLRETGPVTLNMGETSATLADHGRADALTQFVKDCQVK
jgi:hypothetical protein